MSFLLTTFRALSALLMVAGFGCLIKADFNSDLDGPYDYYTRNSVPRPFFRQFDSWYPDASGHLQTISEGICNQTLRDYRASYAAPRGSDAAAKLIAICYRHEACILDQAGANWTANLTSAGVLLGLLPTLLSTFGPRVSEIGILFAHRPVLTLLMSLGAPMVWPSTRIFEYDDPRDVFKDEHLKLAVPRQGKWLAALFSMVEYVLVLASAGLTLHTTLMMGRNALLAWGCTTQFAPLLCILMSLLITLAAAASFKLVAQSKTELSLKASKLRRVWRFICERELTICANHDKSSLTIFKSGAAAAPTGADQSVDNAQNQHQHKAHDSRIAVLLNVAAGCGGFVALVYATIVLASLQFASFQDVCKNILWRLLVSTAICRLVMIMELGGLRSP